MKSLQETKDEIAVEQGFSNWEELYNASENGKFLGDNLIDLVATRHSDNTLKEAAERAVMIIEEDGDKVFTNSYIAESGEYCIIDKQSILSLIKDTKYEN